MTTPRALAFACCLFLGCSGGTSQSDSGAPPVDGGGSDAGASDAGPADAGTTDAGRADAGAVDAGVDAGPPTCGLEATLTIPSAVAAKGVVLDAGTFLLSGQPRPYQLLKLPGADGKPVYAQWVPGGDGGPAPVLLLADAYDGIDWSGEAVDTRWAGDGGCLTGCVLPDVDGPMTGPDAGELFYQLQPAPQAATSTGLYVLNGMSALIVYGRNYAGTTFFQQGQAVAAGLRFLEQRTDVDKARIGVIGGSLGGFDALSGASFAPAGATPKVVAALYPIGDIPQWLQYINVELPPQLGTDDRRYYFARFLDPYQRRAVAGASGQLQCFSNAFFAGRISGQVLLAQDTWDMISPHASQKDLLAKLGPKGASLFYEHVLVLDRSTQPLSHVLDQEAQFPSHTTLSLAWVLNALVTGPQVLVPYNATPMRAFFTRVRDLHRGGFSQAALVPRLVELADPRVQLYELTAMTFTPGDVFLAAEINAVFGTNFTAAQIANQLKTNGLPN